MTGQPSPHLEIRRATASDAQAVADVFLSSFKAALPKILRPRSDEEVLSWMRREVAQSNRTWVAAAEEGVIGMMVVHGAEIEHLYLAPAWRGHRIGDRLVDLAKELSPAGLKLWTFQVNEPAQRFYVRHGFFEFARTDGNENEHREPDIRYVWQP